MISQLENINDRQIIYVDIENNPDELILISLNNWSLLIIADEIENPIISDFSNFCIDNNVQYVSAVGKACSEIDDHFDE